MTNKNFLRNWILSTSILIAATASLSGQATNTKIIDMENLSTKEFPALPYGYDALEPYIDARTMEIHYDRHHRAYFNNYVAATERHRI